MTGIDASITPTRNQNSGLKQHGFTLVEVLITISIMVLLAGLVFGLVGTVRDKNAITTTEMLLTRINSGLEKYKSDNGDYPDCGIRESDYDDSKQPGWRFSVEDETGTQVSGTMIPNRYVYQQSSFVLWKALYYDPKHVGDEPYVEYNSVYIDETTRDDYDDDSEKSPEKDFCRRVDWGSDNWGGDYFRFGFFDYWGEPLIYMYWQDEDDRPDSAPKAIPGFETSYELWSPGLDHLFGDFFPEGEEDRDADNISAIRMPMVKELVDRYDP
ncbi:MAG: type II secretion system protein [Planctomycetes bacterium]|nr:type II secretion system protein [Planctomycetota bacterium]